MKPNSGIDFNAAISQSIGGHCQTKKRSGHLYFTSESSSQLPVLLAFNFKSVFNDSGGFFVLTENILEVAGVAL